MKYVLIVCVLFAFGCGDNTASVDDGDVGEAEGVDTPDAGREPQCSEPFTCSATEYDCEAGIPMYYTGLPHTFTLTGFVDVVTSDSYGEAVFLDARLNGFGMLSGSHTFALTYTCEGMNAWTVATLLDGESQTTVGADTLGDCNTLDSWQHLIKVQELSEGASVHFSAICY